jgi:dihydrolipoamide dehydrogenase
VSDHYDVAIIGGGPGGYAAALYGAAAGLNIAMVEKAKVGGTCLHVGCIPAKELLETAATYRHVQHAEEFGIIAELAGVDWSVTMARKQKVVDGLWKGLQSLLKSRKVTTFIGSGTLHPNRTVRVSGGESGDAEFTADTVILASGSLPRTIPGFDIDGELVVTSDELLSIEKLPKTAVVIGGGAIGCEFASMMSDLGTKVTILEALPKILPGLDRDVTQVVLRSFKKRGLDVRTGVAVTGHKPTDHGTTEVSFGEGETLEVELVVVSVGRRPNSMSLGLEGAQTAVKVDERGFIEVDELCRTAEDGIYAVGDVIATPQLAHVGFAEGILVIKDILGEDPFPVDYG